MYIRPLTLQDTTIDFANFPQGYIYSSTGLNATDHALQYYLIKNGSNINSNPLLITTNGVLTTNYSVTKENNNVVAYLFRRAINNPGLYSDKINYFNKIVNLSTLDQNYNLERPYLTESHIYNYYIFQSAVSIVKVGTQGQTIRQNQTAVMNINDSILIDGSYSRGYENGYILNIYKRMNSGIWALANKDSDFSLSNGINPMQYIFTPLLACEFKVVFQVTGFNSNSNNFDINNDIRDLIIDNSDRLSFYINSGVIQKVDTITLPQIQTNVSTFLDSNSNLQGYTNTQITVDATILYNTGIWSVNGVLITPTNDQWLENIYDNSNIKLHIQDNTSKDILPPFNGFGPHKIMIPSAIDCTFKYILTNK